MKTHHITLIPGDGIGPEVIAATRRLIDAGVRIAWDEVHTGASVFRKGIASGVPRDTIDSISRTRLALKGPLETPVGFDLFTEFGGQPEALGPILENAAAGLGCLLKMISSRGTKVYPPTGAMTDYVDQWRCRFTLDSPADDLNLSLLSRLLSRLLAAVEAAGVRWMHFEKLQHFDGTPSTPRPSAKTDHHTHTRRGSTACPPGTPPPRGLRIAPPSVMNT